MEYAKSLGRFVGWLNYQMVRSLNSYLEEAGAGITADQFRLLTHLWAKDGITQQELADKVGRDRAGITRMVDILEEQGVTVRIPDKEDRRVNRVFLTKKGRDVEKVARRCAQNVIEKATAGFSEAEKTQLSHLLEKSLANFVE